MLKTINRISVAVLLSPFLAVAAIAAYYTLAGRTTNLWGDYVPLFERVLIATGRLAEFLGYGYWTGGIWCLGIAYALALGVFFVTKAASNATRQEVTDPPLTGEWEKAPAHKRAGAAIVVMLGTTAFCSIVWVASQFYVH